MSARAGRPPLCRSVCRDHRRHLAETTPQRTHVLGVLVKSWAGESNHGRVGHGENNSWVRAAGVRGRDRSRERRRLEAHSSECMERLIRTPYFAQARVFMNEKYGNGPGPRTRVGVSRGRNSNNYSYYYYYYYYYLLATATSYSTINR